MLLLSMTRRLDYYQLCLKLACEYKSLSLDTTISDSRPRLRSLRTPQNPRRVVPGTITAGRLRRTVQSQMGILSLQLDDG
ncbi:hypothetical protein J6590_005557 [Homalodisca vitripennis]|nr:hypothetical protein J6590_005557 [Homalodisca vitripennis]